MKTKLTNMLKGKEKIKETKLNRGKWRFIYVLKIDCKGKRTIRKANKGINVKKIIGLKN